MTLAPEFAAMTADPGLLRGRHAGETLTIVGRGPSLLRLVPGDFPDGPVIALNAAILYVRKLGLPNKLYTMQKDGCQPHGLLDNDPAEHDCTLIPPDAGETLLLSLAESRFCLPDAPDRHVIDVREMLGLDWWTMSAPVAVAVARLMGSSSLVMLGHDAYTSKNTNTQRVMPSGHVEDDPHAGYYLAGVKSQELADEYGMAIEWR